MSRESGSGDGALDEIAARFGIGRDSVETMLRAVVAGGGSMAQFNIVELGGPGQWMRGGMTMVGNMFDNELRARVDRLATELATLYFDPPFTLQRELAGASGRTGTDTGAPQGGSRSPWQDGQGTGGMQSQSQGGFGGTGFGGGGNWWPGDLGHPSTAGAQNDSRYAYFPQSRRLAIQRGGGAVELYDTTGYDISGVSQQQGGFGSATFSSAQGPVPLDRLPRVGGASDNKPAAGSSSHPARGTASQDTSSAGSVPAPEAPSPGKSSGGSHGEILDALERLGALKEKGILSEAEFAEKKRDLLARL
ncbi:SHOCT domain-containing protein [Antarcticirhabdus aurantiaca]|uniref:SHOCT domain-containing protein n=1 Tax=Antarcticirhabdus aurantiaca TaxID=2606717 RepID=A0ACD4NM86_9HYPH|nr:SHOCT domain-containing protein [Antarcticirhabdus aurantiaca]WAJ27751.1 SHOCT domain-containing protein [Jeongeuplla avenae]